VIYDVIVRGPRGARASSADSTAHCRPLAADGHADIFGAALSAAGEASFTAHTYELN